MSKLPSAASTRGHEAVHTLFEAGGPALVEVRHPGGVFSSDWYLCDSVDDFDQLIEQLDPAAVIHVNRVWDLHNRADPVVLRR
jgi:hypothetical protein